MADPLASCWEKVHRAGEQIANLRREVDAFLDEAPFGASRVVYCPDNEARQRVLHVHAARDTPLRFGVLAGEIVHNLRSALDHLATQLVTANSAKPTRRTAFPIFVREPSADARATERYAAAVKGMSPRAKAIIHQLQPFHKKPEARAEDCLAVLAQLCNRDKHRELNTTVLSLTSRSKTFFFDDAPSDTEGPDDNAGVLEVEIGGTVSAQISLADPVDLGNKDLFADLEELHEHVRDVIAIFAVLGAGVSSNAGDTDGSRRVVKG